MRRPRGRALVVLAAALLVLLLPGVSHAYHATDDIKVGKDHLNANAQRFHPGEKTMYVGQTATFSFANGAHNVDQASAPGGAAAFQSPNAAGGGGETVGSTWTYNFTVAGDYWYFCNIHAGAGDTPTTFDANSEPTNNKMVGVIHVQTDGTGPTWSAGSATATAASASQIDLTWPSASDPETGVSGYRVYRNTTNSKPASAATTETGTSWSDTGLTAGQTYYYWITAVNGGGGTSATDQTASAATSSVAASSAASGMVKFSVNPTLEISLSPAILDLGAVSPLAAATGNQVANVKSNDTWSLNLKSVGRDGTDGAPGDDQVFTSGNAKTIPVSRMAWKVGAGPSTALTDADAEVLSAQPVTNASGTDTTVQLNLQVQYSDPPASDYESVILYTATQP